MGCIFFLISIILGIISFFISPFSLRLSLRIIALLLMFVGLFWGDASLFLQRRKVRKQGIKTYGVLRGIKPTGWYSKDHNCRELILYFDYLKQDGTMAAGELRDSVDNPIEAKLNNGMMLPVMYNEALPDVLTFEHNLDYSILNEGKELEKKYTISSYTDK